MPLFDDLGRIGTRYRAVRSRRMTDRIMAALPPEIQRDLDWNPPPSLMAKVYRWITVSIRR